MHTEVAQFLRSCSNVKMLGAVVYEVGALNVNGRAVDCLPGGWRSWTGFDLIDGPGVDVVGDAAVTLADWPPCDVLVSTEVLEHAPEWERLLEAMCTALKPGGRLILTCAGPGRPPHAADGTDGGPHEGEWYRNVSLAEVMFICAANGVHRLYGEELGGDTRFYGLKEAL